MRFLIVDDDAACRELLRTILSPYGHCDLAFDGSEAIDAVRLAIEDARPYDLICLDIMMPGIDGHRALDAIRQVEYRQGIHGSDAVKVIMTTALMDSKHCIRAFQEGCESYYTKPIKSDTLLAEIRGLLGGLQPISPLESAAYSPSDPSVGQGFAPPNGRAGQDPGQGGARYLIVDDDAVCRALLEEILQRYGQCTFAYDGQEAVDAVRLALEDNQPFDLICLDIMMPGMNGHDALLAIRRLEAEQGIHGSDGVKVIMTTALRDSKHCIRSFQEGCECYVTKPFEENELLGKMCELGLLTAADSR